MNEYKFILNGKRPEACADLMRFARWFETADRRVNQTNIGEIRVSTVFLGFDHNWNGKGAPVLFETMCFVEGDAGDTLPFNRYRTWEEAEAGHAEAVMICEAVNGAAGDGADDLFARLRSAMEKR